MTKRNSDNLQLNAAGKLKHLLNLDGLDKNFITRLLDNAENYLRPKGSLPARDYGLQGQTVANLFFEPSTRTRASFELAAKRMSADVLNLDVNMSSRIKGESILDTIFTLQAMQVDVFVVRDAGDGIPEFIARNVGTHASVLNAGEASTSHPTQGLLDMLTIRQAKGRLDGLSVTIIGDIAHSRVARSLSHGLRIMGNNDIRLVAPGGMAPDMALYPGASLYEDADTAVKDADVLVALRIQRERIEDPSGIPTEAEYNQRYGLTTDRVALAKPDAIVMHPGPMNRDVEISGKVADGPQSVVRQQVTNGLAVRMAVLSAVMESR
jgi:aspartate carbamoyltransferase catalytic subunit